MVKLLTPSEVPEEVVCRTIKVPNSLEWLGIFNAVLLAGTYYYNWSDDIDTHMTREEAAAAYSVIFNEYLTASMECDVCTLPGGGSAIRQDGFGRWQMLDNGEWQEPSGDYALPPLNPRTEPTDDEKKCLGAANAANVMQQLYEALADEYAENHDLALFFLAIGVSISLIFLPPLGLLAASFLEIATILVAEGFGAFAFLTADVWDSEFTNKFKCILLDNASVDGSGVVTFDFAQVTNDVVNALPFEFTDPTLQKPRLALQLGTILQYVGADGLNYAGSTTAITDDDCSDCDPVWCKSFDFTLSDGGFVAADGVTYYEAGVGWRGGTVGSQVDSALATITFPDTRITFVAFEVCVDNGGGSGFVEVIYLYKDGVFVDNPNEGGSIGCVGYDWEVDHVADQIYLSGNCGTVDGNLRIVAARFCGTGECPFEDCE